MHFPQFYTFGSVSAQEEDASNSENSYLEKGDMIIDLSYSLSAPKGLTWRAIALNTNSDLSQLGPIGVKFQYMATEIFGVGLDASFASRKGAWDGIDFDLYNSNDSTVSRTAEQTIVRVMVRTSWEIIHTKSFQLFWANSVGYRSANWTGDLEALELISSPLALRTAMGMRYFFTESMGLSLEFGLGGGSFVCLGAAIKL